MFLREEDKKRFRNKPEIAAIVDNGGEQDLPIPVKMLLQQPEPTRASTEK